MTILEMMTALETSGDLTVWVRDGGVYDVTVEDFEGFDADWCEVDREIVQEDLLDAFLEALDAQALRVEGDFYYTYYFDGFTVELGYASYDI